jgi:hypothetical protein
MTSLSESVPFRQPHDTLIAGLDAISGGQTVVFQPYVRYVLPIDGYIFWINAQIITPQQLAAAGVGMPQPVIVSGSLHYSSQIEQTNESTYSVTHVVFNTDQPVSAFTDISPNLIYIGRIVGANGTPIRFSFSRHDYYYEEAGIWHFSCHALYSTLASQLIDSQDQFEERQVVSNSLPIWLSMIASPPFGTTIAPPPGLQLYPSLLSPINLEPPYGIVHIPADGTRALQPIPYIDRLGNQWQLMADRVDITLFGLRAREAADFQAYVQEYTLLTENVIGLMRPPAVRDGKRPQVEFQAIAMMKHLEYEVSYNQQTARNVARKMISVAVANILSIGT